MIRPKHGCKRPLLRFVSMERKRKAGISAKVLRSTGDKGSRPSEELPLHRVLDLSILICRSLAHLREAYKYEHLYDPQEPVIDRVGLQGDVMTVAICTDNERINEDCRIGVRTDPTA